jgi:malonyl-CoA/methylmalonyl-CoA synthetase
MKVFISAKSPASRCSRSRVLEIKAVRVVSIIKIWHTRPEKCHTKEETLTLTINQAGFTGATAELRLASLFSPDCCTPLQSASHLQMMRGTVAGREVLAVATDPRIDKGALGHAESNDLRRAVQLAQETDAALVLLIDSAGARLPEGLPIQGDLRRLMREVLDARLDGLPMLALLGRNVFGAASMLAQSASHRCYAPATLLAMTGPRVLQQAGESYETVIAAIDGSARSQYGMTEQLIDDTLSSYAGALQRWVSRLSSNHVSQDLDEQRRQLKQRLQATALAPAADITLDGVVLRCRGQVLAGCADAMRLAELIDAAGPGVLQLELDYNGHSTVLDDERALLSQCLVHLAKTIRRRVRNAQPVHVLITSHISGGIYIAAAAAASSVEMAPGSSVRTLPQSSLNEIFTRPGLSDTASNEGHIALDRYPSLGIADTVFSFPPTTMNANIFATFESIALEAGDAVFIETPEGQTLTYAGMLALTARYANALQALGIAAGDRVAVQVDKSLENLCLYLATVRMGAIYLPLNTGYHPNEVQYFMQDAAPSVFICTPANLATLSALAAANGVVHTLSLGDDGSGSFIDFVEQNAADATTFETARSAADDVALIIYTSGTTGRPKGAMLTHANLLSNGRALTKLWEFGRDDVLLHALPLFHAHGLFISSHCALLSASRILFLKKFDAAQVVSLLPRATAMVGVPTFYSRLLGQADFDKTSAAGMRLFISGSAPLLAETNSEFLQRSGHVILERYGMTESAIISSNPCSGERRIGSVGHAIDGVDVRITDGDDRPLGIDTVGGIQIRGSGVMKGYWRNPDKTAEEFTADGWFRTGDLGTLSADAYLTIVGRAKDLVISGGYNVYPKEVEMAIDALPGVLESAVIGVPDRDFGEAVNAVVVRAEGEQGGLNDQTIIQSLKTQMASYKIPKQVHFVMELPRNAMGKVLKNVLRDTYGKRAPTNPTS